MPRSKPSTKTLVAISLASLVCAALTACAGSDSNLAETPESGIGAGSGGRSVTSGVSGGASATGAASATGGGTGTLSSRSEAAGGQSATGQGRGGARTSQSSGGTSSGAGGTSSSETTVVGGTESGKGGWTGLGGATLGRGGATVNTTSERGGASAIPVGAAPTWNALWANYFKPRCATCHSSAASAAKFCEFLTNIQQLDGTSQPPLTSASGSVLSWFNESGYMPQDTTAVPANAVKDIRAWANAGAVCP